MGTDNWWRCVEQLTSGLTYFLFIVNATNGKETDGNDALNGTPAASASRNSRGGIWGAGDSSRPKSAGFMGAPKGTGRPPSGTANQATAGVNANNTSSYGSLRNRFLSGSKGKGGASSKLFSLSR